MGYESLPEHMIDQTIVQEAQDGGASYSSFLREYCAVFTDGSDSYFSAKKMHECTVPDGEEPTTQIIGKKESKYILAIDPSFSNSPSSDFFAMSILELDDKTEQGTLVHSYAVAGGNLKDHINYLFHVATNFDLEMVIIDNAGYQFIDSANASKLFKEAGIKIEFFDFDSNKEDKDYSKELIRAKRLYNKTSRNICFKQVFTSDFIRRGNEDLQARIDHKKIWFASATAANASSFNEYVTAKVNTNHIGEPTILDFIEVQDALIHQTKKQCALVEVKSTAKGTQTFDLPQHLKRSSSPQRARKDNYTTLMLANWASRCYYDILRVQKGNFDDTFTPFVIK